MTRNLDSTAESPQELHRARIFRARLWIVCVAGVLAWGITTVLTGAPKA